MSLKWWKCRAPWKCAKLKKGFGPKSNAFRPLFCRGCGRRLGVCPPERRRKNYRHQRPKCYSWRCLWCATGRRCGCGRALPLPA